LRLYVCIYSILIEQGAPTQSEGINFAQYDDIPVDISGENVPDPIARFDEPGALHEAVSSLSFEFNVWPMFVRLFLVLRSLFAFQFVVFLFFVFLSFLFISIGLHLLHGCDTPMSYHVHNGSYKNVFAAPDGRRLYWRRALS
jgi:hypothetical protein